MENALSPFKELIYTPCNWVITAFKKEQESQDYAACRFTLNGLNIVCRTAKITPTKTGQFVTLWKRIAGGPIQPFEVDDDLELFIVNVEREGHRGQFIFTKEVLSKKGVVTENSKEGKRAMRVYPPWDSPTSKQAQKTQAWQLAFFIRLNSNQPIDLGKARKLYLQS